MQLGFLCYFLGTEQVEIVHICDRQEPIIEFFYSSSEEMHMGNVLWMVTIIQITKQYCCFWNVAISGI